MTVMASRLVRFPHTNSQRFVLSQLSWSRRRLLKIFDYIAYVIVLFWCALPVAALRCHAHVANCNVPLDASLTPGRFSACEHFERRIVLKVGMKASFRAVCLVASVSCSAKTASLSSHSRSVASLRFVALRSSAHTPLQLQTNALPNAFGTVCRVCRHRLRQERVLTAWS